MSKNRDPNKSHSQEENRTYKKFLWWKVRNRKKINRSHEKFLQGGGEEIKSLTQSKETNQVAGNSNPADQPSQGCMSSEPLQSQRWEDLAWLRSKEESRQREKSEDDGRNSINLPRVNKNTVLPTNRKITESRLMRATDKLNHQGQFEV